jgi:hypothetical protein
VCSPTDQCPDAGMSGSLPQLASHVRAPQSGESASAWRRAGPARKADDPGGPQRAWRGIAGRRGGFQRGVVMAPEQAGALPQSGRLLVAAMAGERGETARARKIAEAGSPRVGQAIPEAEGERSRLDPVPVVPHIPDRPPARGPVSVRATSGNHAARRLTGCGPGFPGRSLRNLIP